MKAGRAAVLYVANAARIGGGNRVLMDMIATLDRTRYTPVLIAPGEGQLTAWAADAGVPHAIVSNRDQSRIGLLRRASSIAWVVLRHGVDIMHANGLECYRAVSLAATMTRAKRVCHVHFPASAEVLAWHFRIRPHVVITCYQQHAVEVRDLLRSAGRDQTVVAIPNAIGLTGFDVPSEAQVAASPWRFGARHVVLIIGHLSEVKGYPAFLHAAARVASTLDGCVFLSLGAEMVSEGYAETLVRLTEQLGLRDRVHFLGWRDRVSEVIAACDVMTLPSLAEGLPIAILETMACGKPVVATPVNGVPEAVVNDVTGFLVPPNDPEALAHAILTLLNDPERARRMGLEGRRRIEERFSLARFSAQLDELYRGLLSSDVSAAQMRSVSSGARSQ